MRPTFCRPRVQTFYKIENSNRLHKSASQLESILSLRASQLETHSLKNLESRSLWRLKVFPTKQPTFFATFRNRSRLICLIGHQQQRQQFEREEQSRWIVLSYSEILSTHLLGKSVLPVSPAFHFSQIQMFICKCRLESNVDSPRQILQMVARRIHLWLSLSFPLSY